MKILCFLLSVITVLPQLFSIGGTADLKAQDSYAQLSKLGSLTAGAEEADPAGGADSKGGADSTGETEPADEVTGPFFVADVTSQGYLESFEIHMDMEQVTPEGCVIKMWTDKEFESKQEAAKAGYTTGYYYRIETKKDGVWEVLPYVEGASVGWDDVSFVVSSDKTRLPGNWEYMYGSLPVGEYRMVKTVMINRATYSLTAEFSIREATKEEWEAKSQPAMAKDEYLNHIKEITYIIEKSGYEWDEYVIDVAHKQVLKTHYTRSKETLKQRSEKTQVLPISSQALKTFLNKTAEHEVFFYQGPYSFRATTIDDASTRLILTFDDGSYIISSILDDEPPVYMKITYDFTPPNWEEVQQDFSILLSSTKEARMNYKVIVLVILTVIYLYRLFLDILRAHSAKNPIPMNVADVYDQETYRTWRMYHFEKTRLNIVSSTVSFILGFILIATDAYAAFAGLFVGGDFMQMLAVVLLLAATDIVLIPFTYYDTMVIEEKYGFNRSSKRTFWMDQLKQFLLSFMLMFLVGCLLIWAHHKFGDWLILVVAVIMTVVVLGIAFLYPFFSKIFNRFMPLEDGELKDKVTALLEGHGYKVRAIQVMDASRRTSKTNAYFSGFGKMKTIVLYDTLVEAMTPDEICAVFAHEMGHGLHKDTLRNQILSFVQMALIAVLAWLTLRSPALFSSFGFTEVNYGFALILIMSVEFALIAPLFGLVVSYFSRKAEYAADAQAVSEGYGPALISALKTLAKENFSDLAPSPIVVKLEYSHPTLSQRIDAIEKALGVEQMAYEQTSHEGALQEPYGEAMEYSESEEESEELDFNK